ncbi:MAG: hypothetical protein A3I75_03385 [Deltaproteobacteria bacterium RIFCSPLOWO2_02_FULL_50_16]|nr:MAG: hypothetical protein A3B79_05990 [Deltaproteobacteria bacterium RIFCSPHIGHO2_02_FULL_50_15]OGQ57770.1 MAG: hypothetical protein A3I75_03385 [Deltaproteobacteria bacterium RIFCSPLOWO2_02_FULL_50_16]
MLGLLNVRICPKGHVVFKLDGLSIHLSWDEFWQLSNIFEGVKKEMLKLKSRKDFDQLSAETTH